MHGTLRAILAVFFICLPAFAADECFPSANSPSSNIYPACCPETFSMGTTSVSDNLFVYYCGRFLDKPLLHSPVYNQYNPKQCLDLCATDPLCKATAWARTSRICYLYGVSPFTDEKFVLEHAADSFTMIKSEGQFNATPPVPCPPVGDCQKAIDDATKECKDDRDKYKRERNECRTKRDKYKQERDDCKTERGKCEKKRDEYKQQRDNCQNDLDTCRNQLKACPPVDPDNARLNTPDLCPDYDRHEFSLPTPGGGETKWRVYCHHEMVQFPLESSGYLNNTETAYSVLLASRHWDRGYRGFRWSSDPANPLYKHGTTFNLRPSDVPNMERRVTIYHRPYSTTHVIMRVDDIPFTVSER